MAAIRTPGGAGHAPEHIQPSTSASPPLLRRIHAQLEQIDYMTYACNREVVSHHPDLATTNAETFERLALGAAVTRVRWISKAVAITAGGSPSPAQTLELTELRCAYQELADAYEALRRMVERGYVTYSGPPPPVIR